MSNTRMILRLTILQNALSRYAHDHLRDPQGSTAKTELAVIMETENQLHTEIGRLVSAPTNALVELPNDAEYTYVDMDQETTPILDLMAGEPVPVPSVTSITDAPTKPNRRTRAPKAPQPA